MNSTPTHHPAEATLLRYAAATLPPCLALVVATHLPFCAECGDAVRFGEAMGGALLADQPPTDLTDDALARTLSRLDAPAFWTAHREEKIELAPGVALPDALRGFARTRWRWLAPGISRIAVSLPGARDVAHLLRVAPGKSMPDHGHDGWEAACILSGGFSDVTGHYRAGDVAEADVSIAHQPVADPGEACICLIAWEGRLRLRGRVARVLQPLLGL